MTVVFRYMKEFIVLPSLSFQFIIVHCAETRLGGTM